MAERKRPYYNDYGGYEPPRTPPDAPASRGYTPSRTSCVVRAPKSARTSYHSQPSRAAPGSSQYAPLVIDDEVDEDDASQEVQDPSQSFGETDMSYVLYGVISTKIVGVRYYNGHANVGEIAIPRREPHNQYDSECPVLSAAAPTT